MTSMRDRSGLTPETTRFPTRPAPSTPSSKRCGGNGLDGPANGGNSPNVWAELGSVWRDYMHDPASAAHLLGKLITHVGPRRVVWGTDSLWYGSPQAEIVALRRFDFSEEGKALYGLPYGLEGDAPGSAAAGARAVAHYPQRHLRPQRR